MNSSEFTKEDYLKLKWHFVLLLLCIAMVGASFYWINTMSTEAGTQLNRARSDMNTAQAALEQIEQEEAAIAEYIGRFEMIAASGMVQTGDRLAMQENFANIRSDFSLFPIQLNIGGQSSFVLPYDPLVIRPGKEVTLQTSVIQTTVPLLHEDDLARLLARLRDGPELLLAEKCEIASNTRNRGDLLRLGQHMNASCTFRWYTFAIEMGQGI
jgi:hypothetical protein